MKHNECIISNIVEASTKIYSELEFRSKHQFSLSWKSLYSDRSPLRRYRNKFTLQDASRNTKFLFLSPLLFNSDEFSLEIYSSKKNIL